MKKITNKKHITSKSKKRIVCFAVSIAMLTSSLPMNYIADNLDVLNRKLTVYAAGTGTERTFSDLGTFKAYVTEYNSSPSTHKNDILTFTFGGSSTNQEFNCDSIGLTEEAAFDGKIILGTGMQFNMVNSLFKYVTDDVEIVNNSGAAATMVFTRPRPGDNAPLFAENVIHSRASGNPVEWNFEYTTYNSGDYSYTYDVAGFIGTLGSNAKVRISSISFNNLGTGSEGTLIANIVSNSAGDAGLVCGTMGTSSQLEIDYITSLTADKSFSITASSSGNAGGLVGSMSTGSKLLLGNSLECFQAADAAISASNGYAGGIVGKCDGGVIARPEITASSLQASMLFAQSTQESNNNIEENSEETNIEAESVEDASLPAASDENEAKPESEEQDTNEETQENIDEDENVQNEIIQSESADIEDESDNEAVESEEEESVSEPTDEAELESQTSEDNEAEENEEDTSDTSLQFYTRSLASSGATASADYTVSQIITGSKGSGGVAGYYRAVTDNSSENAVLNTKIVDLKTGKFKVNGAGACGGLFGEVFNNGTNMTITNGESVASEVEGEAPTISGDVVPDHNNGTASSYGGLIGKYYASAQTLELTVSGPATIAPKRTGGDAANYGGVIGIVDKNSSTSAYVKINGVTVNSSNAAVGGMFGGVIARADEAFVELADTNIISYAGIATDKNFAGIVGSLETGVLCLSGNTDLSGAATIASATAKSGQIVGYRNCGFVFAKSGWKLYRSTVGQKVDDIGSWGEVVRFNEKSSTDNSKLVIDNVIILDDTNHHVTIKKRSVTNYHKDLASTEDFAVLALNIQHNTGTDGNVLKFEEKNNFKSSTILTGKDISIAENKIIDLRGTGITGLTRDNSYNGTDESSYMEFKRKFNGTNYTITLAIGEPYGYVRDESEDSGERLVTANDVGCGIIYRHKYNGLFARINNQNNSGTYTFNANSQYTNGLFSSNSIINVESCVDDMKVGTIAAYLTSNTAVHNVYDVISEVTINHAGGGKNFYIGGLIGQVDGSISFDKGTNNSNKGTGCKFTGSIQDNGNTSSAIVGGLVGYISANTFTSSIKNATVSGNIKSTGSDRADQKIGGLIGVIGGSGTSSARTLALQNVSINGLTVEGTATDSSGGLLGYNWFKTDVTFGNGSSIAGVTVTDSTMKTTAPKTAGLVYEASGYWNVQNNGTDKEGIKITSATINAANAASFGCIINKGAYSSSAIYLELKKDSYKIASLTTSALNSSVGVFDELVAFSKFDDKDICENGQGIVSINTGAGTAALLKMGSDDTNTGVTYQKQTGFTPTSYCNPNTRYYYNLDAYRTTATDAAPKFLIWSVKTYAHSTLSSYFTAGYSGTIGEADADLDMRGYSYYPVDVTGTVKISGNIKLWNSEFDATENATTCKRKSLGTTPVSQHYTMHNSLFRNVTGSLTASSLKLDGNVSIDSSSNGYCGALVMGTVSSNNTAKPATVTVNGLTLNGIKVNGADASGAPYAPLLINQSGSNATFVIQNVSTGNTSSATVYSNPASATVGSTNPIIASSLIGDLGSKDATSVKVTFDSIKLDGRKATSAGTDNLDSVYYTRCSLFSRATLLNSLAYSDSSSYGRYYYKIDKDWNGTIKIGNVTYGAEIVASVENSGKQNKYDGSNYYTHPTKNDETTSEYSDFGTNYQNYVYTGFNSDNKTHELRVNITSVSFGGCGTYNDPYVIVSGENLETIAKIINGTWTGDFTISVPNTVTDSSQSTSWCNGTANHNTFTSYTKAENDTNRTNSKWKTAANVELTDAAMAKYLAGAYYQIPSSVTEDITLGNDFAGFSNNVSADYVFHGVIDGNEKTIINQSANPLIVSSNGSVVRNLTITVKPNSAKEISTDSNSAKFISTTGTGSCSFYGAVIGQILGGDNIIDKVSVGFAANPTSSNEYVVDAHSASHAQLVPIGGYVGVVVNGGLIFKNMGGSTVSRTGITDAQLTGFGDSPLTSDNYLYINPIIGRVINGYAVTENSSYHWSETAEARTDTKGVTMHNGTKNYSIADIGTGYSDSEKLTIAQVSGRDTVNLPNAQSMFVLSLLTQSNMTANAYTSGTYGGYLRNADYDEIGSSAVVTGDYASVSATYPYLVNYYVNTGSQSSIATLTSSSTAYDFSLGGTAEKWYLPDGFRGIGCIGFGMTYDSDMNNRTFTLNNFSGKGNYGTGSVIDINLNTSVKHYAADVDNYLPINTAHGGLGLFNKFRQTNSGTAEAPDEISYLKLSGKINYDVVGITNYISANVHDNSYLHVGGLAGCIGSGAETDTDDIRVEQIGIDGLEVNGFESAGGFFGYLVMANSESGLVNISNVTSTSAFTVTSKRYAGGLIGYFGQGNLTVSDVTITQPNVLSYFIGNGEQDFENGVGGIIGFAQNENNTTVNDSTTYCNPVELCSITIGAVNATNANRIGYYNYTTSPFTDKTKDTIIAGGIVGRANTKPKTANSSYSMRLNNCNVYNINVYGHRVGGLIGSDTGGGSNDSNKAWSKILIIGCNVKSDNNSIIYGVSIGTQHRACGGIIGGERTNGVTIESSSVEGYTLQSLNDTGGITAHTEKGALTLRNLLMRDVTIISNYCGCLVGWQNVHIKGYNILADNVQFQDKDGTAALQKDMGYIVGKNKAGGTNVTTKIVGFSRQNTTPKQGCVVPDRMTGLNSNNNGQGDEKVRKFFYGTNGYVIFSDYNGTASKTGHNTAFSANTTTNPLTAVNASDYDESPYVMVNPRKNISDTQFFTSDGVSSTAYGTSAAKSIIVDIDGASSAKRYQSTGISDENLNMLKSLLPNKISSFSYELGKANISTAAANYSGKDFPVLVIDDITNVDPIVKNYIRLLTNTSYTYQKNNTNSSIYTVDISKWKYSQSNGVFEKQTGDAALKYDTSRNEYYILATEWDNVDYQISLIDVQFKDPSENSTIAYHLYIPVMVEKMLYYDVYLRPASGTTYQLSAYPDSETNLIENLGNPVTMRVTYSYDQSSSDWAKSINNGENVQRNYDKSLMLKVTHEAGATGIPSNAKIILVDPNKNVDKMYSADYSTANTALLSETNTTSGYTNYNLNLNGFTGFTVCKMNDLMKISTDSTATTKNLVVCSGSETPTVIINDPTDANYGKKLRMKTGNEVGAYAVKVTDWEGKSFTRVEENYYLSIFTKANESDTTIYHYEFDSDTSFRNVAYPSARMNDETSHILLGNLYNNEIVGFTDDNTNTVISKSNNYLEATITAEVGFKGKAIDSNIIGYIKDNDNMAIYQTFLVALQKIKDDATSLGIVLTPECSFDYSVNGTPIAETEKKECKDLGAYVEFPTSHSIKDALCTEALKWDSVHKDNEDDCKITIKANVRMSYAKYGLESLVEQFPESTGSDGNGTKMVGYSNISSSSENGSSSSESDTTLTKSNLGTRRLYYMDSIKPVTLTYLVSENSDFLKNGKDGNANFGQLGINAQPDANEVTDGVSPIHSLISYNASEYTLRSNAKFMKIQVELSAKENKVIDGFEKAGYYSTLPISTYHKSFKLLDSSGTEVSNGTPENASFESDSDTNIYTYVIPLSALKSMGAYEYEVPVNFEVYTGENANFQTKNLTYANYRVHVTVSLLDKDKSYLRGSEAKDWIIYTNARIYRDIITD